MRWLIYLWALPNTLLGLLVGGLGLLAGGRARRVDGVLEVHGPAVAWCLRRLMPWVGGAAALTLGHVVLGCDAHSLVHCRDHERVHVRQCERWGPFFLPAYLASSLAAWLRGGDPYRDNRFEREAYGLDSDSGADRGAL